MSFSDLPSLCMDFGPFWMFKLEQTEKDFQFAAKLRDVFRSDFEMFIVYYYGDILKSNDDEQFNCCHLQTMSKHPSHQTPCYYLNHKKEYCTYTAVCYLHLVHPNLTSHSHRHLL